METRAQKACVDVGFGTKSAENAIIIRGKKKGVFQVTKEMKNIKGDPGCDGGVGGADLIPSTPGLMDRFRDIMNLVKTLGTYQQKLYSTILVLQYELVQKEADEKYGRSD